MRYFCVIYHFHENLFKYLIYEKRAFKTFSNFGEGAKFNVIFFLIFRVLVVVFIMILNNSFGHSKFE